MSICIIEYLGVALTMISLSSSAVPITHLFHFADIHIRNGDIERARYFEYEDVFRRSIQCLDTHEAVSNETALIVIAGDLFHHKGKMDTPALKLYFSWMDQLLARAPVLMICGNHDFRQEDPRHPDMMETMTVPYEHQRKTKFPLFYLKETGHYTFNNVGFGVVSVRDTLKAYNTSGQVDKLPEFPNVATFGDVCDVRVALFHGTITQSALPNEQRISEMHGYPLEWFKGYDLVMLGDNHKQQSHTKPVPWGYPGSLIQQDFGEPTIGHGFLLWDLQDKKCTMHHVYNPNGMITVKWSQKQECYVVPFGKKDIARLEEATRRENFPQMPRIRIIGTSDECEKVREELSMHAPHIKPVSIITTSSLDPVKDALEENTENVREKIMHLSDLNESMQWIEYLKGVAPDLDVGNWLLHPETLRVQLDEESTKFLPTDIQQKINDRNTRIQKAIDEYRETLHTKQNGARIILKNMAWDYAMCYGQGNFFDFSKIQNNIALLNGKNASGKSSFLDVLCIGLYGEPTKHRNMLSGKKMSAKMIHDHRPSHKSVMKVCILFTLNDEDYEIVRSFTTQKKDDNSMYAQLNGAHIYKVNLEQSERRVICEGSVMVDQWVTTYFGSVDDMLMSTIVCQLDLTNFFYMKQDEQKAILDHAMQLESISAFAKVIKEAILAHNEWITLVRTALQTIETNTGGDIVTEKNMEELMQEITGMKVYLDELQEENMKRLAIIGDTSTFDHMTQKEITQELKKIDQKLTEYADIDENDMESAVNVKGEKARLYIQCRDAVAELRERLGDKEILPENECVAQMERLQKKMERHRAVEQIPQVSKEYLEKLGKELNTWKNKYPVEWVSDPDELHTTKEEYETHLSSLKEYQSGLAKKAISRPEGKEVSGTLPENYNITKEKSKYTALCDTLDALRDEIVVPVRKESDYTKWREEWEKWKSDTADVANGDSAETLQQRCEEYEAFIQAYKQKESELATLEKDITMFQNELNELADIPFNQECWACQLQPVSKRRVQIQTTYTKMEKMMGRVKKHIDQYRKHGEVMVLETELKQLRKQLNVRMFYEQTMDHMEREHQVWEQAVSEWAKRKDWEERLQTLTLEKAQMEKLLHIASWKQWNKWTQKMDAVAQEIHETELELMLMNTFMTEYDTRDKDMILLQEQTDHWAQHDAWKELFNTYQDEYTMYQTMQEYWELLRKYRELEVDMGKHGKDIERIQHKRSLLDRVNVLSRAQCYHEWKVKDAEIQTYNGKYQDLMMRHAVMKATFKAQRDKKDQIDWYTYHLNKFVDVKQKLVTLEGKFVGDKASNDGYKEWIYREKVVPLVENEVNRFLSTIETIRLRITYERKCFMYFLEDRGNTPTLDKASGYQNFVVGLAMRLALARIGAIGQNVRHLFIDEGFTAFDVSNIEKVPQILHGIMTYGGYESIMLMSHLEHVQEASEKRIDIERKGMFSFIRYGDAYPEFTTIIISKPTEHDVSKKRGRPKKVIDA